MSKLLKSLESIGVDSNYMGKLWLIEESFKYDNRIRRNNALTGNLEELKQMGFKIALDDFEAFKKYIDGA